MAYTAPPYTGAQYLYEGIASAGSSFAKAMEERRKNEKEQAAADFLVEHAHSQGQLSEEEYNKYQSGSLQAKKGIAFQVMSNIHSDWKRKESEAELKVRAAQLQNLQQQMQQPNWQPSFADRQEAGASGYNYVKTQKGYEPVSAGKAAKGDDWANLNKEVQAATGADLGDWQNAQNKRIEGDSVVGDLTKPDAFGQSVQRTIRAPKKTYEQFLGRFNALSGSQGGAAIGVSPQEQANKIKADYQAKKITKEEARKQLEALGIFQ